MRDKVTTKTSDAMEITQLRAKLKALGGSTQGRMSRETLLKRIAEFEGIETVIILDDDATGQEEVSHITEKPISVLPRQNSINSVLGYVETVVNPPKRFGGCSEEQVMDAVKANIARGMTASFVDNCWTFSLNGKIDSGTMSQPIYNIKKCADLVCQKSISASMVLKNASDR